MNEQMFYYKDTLLSRMAVRLSFIMIVIICVIIIWLGITCEWPSPVEGRFSLTKGCRPYSITAQCRGEVSYLANINDTVRVDEPIAYMLGHGDYTTIVRLKHQLEDSDSNFIVEIQTNKFYGDLSVHINNYITAINEYKILSESKISDLNVRSNAEQIKSLREKRSNIMESIYRTEEESEILTNQSKQDSSLLSHGAITKFEAEKSKLLSIQKQTELLQLKSELTIIDKYISELMNDSKIIKTLKLEEIAKLENTIKTTYSELKEAVAEWFNRYELRTPICGILENPLRINNRQTVDVGTEIFRVLPVGDLVEGEIYFDASKSYGIKEGMSVKLILDDYDENDYGFLVGHIKDISSSIFKTNELSGYTCIVMVDLSNPSAFHAPLDFKHGMSGIVKFNIHQKSLWDKFRIWFLRKSST